MADPTSEVMPLPDLPAERDHLWERFVADYLATGVAVIGEDFEAAHRYWLTLSFNDRLARASALVRHAAVWDNPRFIPRPLKFLQQEWKREPVDRRPVSSASFTEGVKTAMRERIALGMKPWW